MSSEELVDQARQRLNAARAGVRDARDRLSRHEALIEEALIFVSQHQIDVQHETARLATFENEIGNIRSALLKRGIVRTR